jgi:hypothetical protein
MSRPAQAVINLQALKDNLAFARRLSRRKVVGVIKARTTLQLFFGKWSADGVKNRYLYYRHREIRA